MTEQKIADLEKNIENLRKKKTQLRQQLPPRPLPQPEFVQGSFTLRKNLFIYLVSPVRASVAPNTIQKPLQAPKPPPVLRVDDLVIHSKPPPGLLTLGDIFLTFSIISASSDRGETSTISRGRRKERRNTGFARNNI